jgi:hypothetical protein
MEGVCRLSCVNCYANIIHTNQPFVCAPQYTAYLFIFKQLSDRNKILSILFENNSDVYGLLFF